MPIQTSSLILIGIFVGLVVLRFIFTPSKRSRAEQRHHDERAHWKANGSAKDFRPDA